MSRSAESVASAGDLVMIAGTAATRVSVSTSRDRYQQVVTVNAAGKRGMAPSVTILVGERMIRTI